jgi:hypothetical protein
MFGESDQIYRKLVGALNPQRQQRLRSSVMNDRCNRLLLDGDVGGALNFYEEQKGSNNTLGIPNDQLLLSRIYSECGEHYKALDCALRVTDLAGQIR